MTIFDINVYWNITSITSVVSSSTFKLFMLILGFAAFWSSEELDVDIRMRSQNVERFKRIVQQILKKLNLEKFSSWFIIRSAHEKLKKKAMILMISETRLFVRDDCLNWLFNIVTVVYNNQRTIINWRRNVCHEVDSALLILFLLFLYWTNISFWNFIYISAFIAFRS